MISPSAPLAAASFAVLAVLHVFWAFGVRWGAGVAIPERNGAPAFIPGKWATLTVAFLLLAAALVVCGRAGFWTTPSAPAWIFRLGVWTIAAVFALRTIGDFRYCGLFRRVSGTRFAAWDRWLFTPLCGLLAALVVAVALGP